MLSVHAINLNIFAKKLCALAMVSRQLSIDILDVKNLDGTGVELKVTESSACTCYQLRYSVLREPFDLMVL